MRRIFVLTASLLTACMSAPPPVPTAAYIASTSFGACDDSVIDVACNVKFHLAMNLYPDGTATSEVEALNGSWSLTAAGDIVVNGLTFRYSPQFQSYFHALSDTGRWGLHIVPTSSLDPWWSRSDLRLEEPGIKLETLHYLLDHRRRVHDACLQLVDAGTSASVSHIVSVLPTRAEHPAGAGFPCTIAHCLEALRKITGNDHGPFREDWLPTLTP